MAQTILGIYPFAPAHILALVRPTLPPWLKTVIVRNIRVGEASVSIQFKRSIDGATTHKVLEKIGRLHVVEIAPPQDARRGQRWRETLSRWLLERAPGRTAAALRVALGDEA